MSDQAIGTLDFRHIPLGLVTVVISVVISAGSGW